MKQYNSVQKCRREQKKSSIENKASYYNGMPNTTRLIKISKEQNCLLLYIYRERVKKVYNLQAGTVYDRK